MGRREAVEERGDEMGCAQTAVMMLDEQTAGVLAETFRVLADPTRVQIISALAEGPLCVHELAAALAVTHSAVSHQLAMLREMRLVTFEKEGRHVIYRLDDAHIHDLFRLGLVHIRHRGTVGVEG
jgi:ArsR family transcriptional regulator, lead/cadmium/zinc/bismuth-responsive transcriptional repressor